MVVAKVVKVVVAGAEDAYPMAEDALTHLKCLEVTDIRHEDLHFVIEGWLPEEWYDELRMIFEEGTDGRVVVERDPDADPRSTDAPVLLKNPSFARPFEPLVELFSLPRARRLDPTLLTTVLLPLLFGLVIGDIGHGLVLVAVGLFVHRRFATPLARFAASLLVQGGVWSILFGTVVYGDVFAFHFEPAGVPIPLVHRLADARLLFLVALVVGALHLGLGLLLGWRYERQHAGTRVAAFRRTGHLLVLAAAVLLVLAGLGPLLDLLWIPALGFFALAVVLVGVGGGMVDIIEIPVFLSHLLSYLRLAVLALAEAVLAMTANLVVTSGALPSGPVGWLLGGFLLIVLHALVLGLAVFFVTLHVVRLHYVEFYPEIYPTGELGATEPFTATQKIED